MLPNKDKPWKSASDPAAEKAVAEAVKEVMAASVGEDSCECQGRNPADGPCQKCTEDAEASKPVKVLVLGSGHPHGVIRCMLGQAFKVKTLVRAPAITREQAAERQRVAERAAWNAAVTRKKWTGK